MNYLRSSISKNGDSQPLEQLRDLQAGNDASVAIQRIAEAGAKSLLNLDFGLPAAGGPVPAAIRHSSEVPSQGAVL